MKRKYKLVATDEVVDTLEELSEMLGEDITEEDIVEGGQFADLVEIENPEAEEIDKSVVYETVSKDVKVSKEEVEKSIPEFESLDELKEFISDLDMKTLEYLAKGLELEWKPTYHAGIHRMRVAMSMHKYFFPEMFKTKEKTDTKPAKYGDFSIEELEEMAEKNEIGWNKTGTPALDKVTVITALRESGHKLS